MPRCVRLGICAGLRKWLSRLHGAHPASLTVVNPTHPPRHVGHNLSLSRDLIKEMQGRVDHGLPVALLSSGSAARGATVPRWPRTQISRNFTAIIVRRRLDLESSTVTRLKAMNEHWRGTLRLSSLDRTVVLEGPGVRGRYQLADGVLQIDWDSYPAETFRECSGWYVADAVLRTAPDLDTLLTIKGANKPFLATRIHVVADPASQYEVALRLGTTDTVVFSQIFTDREYDAPSLPAAASTIVDLGANIGLATVFFGLRYPQARLLSVEPERQNFDLLATNVAALGQRVQKQQVAVWSKDGIINLHVSDAAGHSLGARGYQTSESTSTAATRVPCYNLATLLDIARFPTADIVKIDIEGAEHEIFSREPARWLPRVNLIIVEAHDRFRPGAERAVRTALAPWFEELPGSGENLIFRRIST
jgi:FkbM family methyltransferase